MKKLILSFVLTLCSQAFAQDITLRNFDNWVLPDIAKQGLDKKELFKNMNRTLIKTGSSVCSNRAHVWGYDFKRFDNFDSGKIFMFYTKDQRTSSSRKTWWYHVSPMLNQNGQIWVMDAGFGSIKEPQTTQSWLKKFAGSSNCKEIQAEDTDLLKRMFRKATFPQQTKHGHFDCYYIYTPYTYWVPSAIPKKILGVDKEGKPINFTRDEIHQGELFTACDEAVTSSLQRRLGQGKNICSEYL